MSELYGESIGDHVEVLRSIAASAELLATYRRKNGEEPCEAGLASLICLNLEVRADAIEAAWRRPSGTGERAPAG